MQAPAPGTRSAVAPAYHVERWEENYLYLRDPANRGTDYLDPIKYVPLNANGDWYLSLGGHVRERYEFFNNYLFSSGPQDDNGYWLTRIFTDVDVHFGQNLRAFFELKSTMVDNREGGPRPTDSDEFDVQEAFLDFNVPVFDHGNFTARFGRQEVVYGAERLLGLSNWSNNRRTDEGLRMSLATGNNTLDAFVLRPVIFENEAPNEGDRHNTFWGLYDTLKLPDVLPKANTALELYGIVLNRTKAAATPYTSAIAVDSDTYTLGFRFVTKPRPWDFEVEADYQFGQYGTGNINAFSVATDFGYTFGDMPLTPRVNLGFDIASGDRDPANPDRQTFNQLFPSGHTYFGYIDYIGRQNIIDLHPGAQLTLAKNKRYLQSMTLRADYHIFWRESTADAVYTTSGSVLRADNGSNDSFVGSELDLLLNWQIDRHLTGYLGYSHFWEGDFIQHTGASRDTDFFYAAIEYDF